MHYRFPITQLSALVLTALAMPLISGYTHHLGPKMEPVRVARDFGLAECDVSESMRRYEALDFANLLGNPHLADSPEWATVISMMQPGDRIRYVNCKNGGNYFGLFRGKAVLFKFGAMLY